MAGGHPRESLEASFDIIQEEHANGKEMITETLIVASQIISILTPTSGVKLPFGSKSPMWYVRLGHTRLSDAILELCGVPHKDTLRRFCLRMFTKFTAPAPSLMSEKASKAGRLATRGVLPRRTRLLASLEHSLNEATDNHGLPIQAAGRLRAFLEQCLPLPHNAADAINSLVKAIANIKKRLA